MRIWLLAYSRGYPSSPGPRPPFGLLPGFTGAGVLLDVLTRAGRRLRRLLLGRLVWLRCRVRLAKRWGNIGAGLA